MSHKVDVRQALTYVFDDPDWVSKSLIGGLVSLVFVLNFAAVGYQVRAIRNVWRGEVRPLPRWDDLGGMFTEGLWLGVARFALALPILILVFVPVFAFMFLAPLAPLLAGSEAQAERWLSGALGIWLAAGGLLCGLAVLFGLVLSFFTPAMDANYARRGTLAACFDFREMLRFIRANGSNYLLAWGAGIGAAVGLNLIFLAAYAIPCIGALAAIPISAAGVLYILLVTGNAVGQLLRLEDARNAAPVGVPAAAV